MHALKQHQARPRVGFTVIRTDEELMGEIELVEVEKLKNYKKNNKFLAFEQKSSRHVVNEVENFGALAFINGAGAKGDEMSKKENSGALAGVKVDK
jgi:hypothetical protein